MRHRLECGSIPMKFRGLPLALQSLGNRARWRKLFRDSLPSFIFAQPDAGSPLFPPVRVNPYSYYHQHRADLANARQAPLPPGPCPRGPSIRRVDPARRFRSMDSVRRTESRPEPLESVAGTSRRKWLSSRIQQAAPGREHL
jgi:hypothetical protein